MWKRKEGGRPGADRQVRGYEKIPVGLRMSQGQLDLRAAERQDSRGTVADKTRVCG